MPLALSTILFILTCAGPSKPELGHNTGRLSGCPAPNCVSSQTPEDSRYLPPLKVIGKPAEAISAVRKLLLEQKRTRIVSQSNDYIHAEVRSAVFGFVDDVEFQIDGDSRLQFRSAARTGYWDFGVNRRRMVRLCNDLLIRYQSLFKKIE
jgi:uncharacterized protein (DUF1499 family)